MLRRLTIAFLTLALLLVPALMAPSARADAASLASMRANAARIADLFDRHNAIRDAQGLPRFQLAVGIVENVSQPWTMQMASSGNLSHNPDYGWSGATAWAENVAYNNYSNATEVMMTSWMNSPGHRQNMLNPIYTTIAIGAVMTSDGTLWGTANFYRGNLTNPGALYSSGAEFLAAFGTAVDQYITEGTHQVNGRLWRTDCEVYSAAITRCWTDIWATQVTYANGRFVQRTGWYFNTLTYAPAPKSAWGNHNYARTTSWTDSTGRPWRTECHTAVTGPMGCRTYLEASVIASYAAPGGGYTYRFEKRWILNSIVRFSTLS